MNESLFVELLEDNTFSSCIKLSGIVVFSFPYKLFFICN